MKTTVVPAQITTVEDRIAGSLTLPQIVLMIFPLITSVIIYAGIPHRMHFSVIKIVLMALQVIFFGLLAIRFRGKIVAEWLVIYIRFAARPRQYVFTKNDIVARDIEISPLKKPDVAQNKKTNKKSFLMEPLALPDTARVNSLLENSALTVSYKLAKKGGLDVSLKPIKR